MPYTANFAEYATGLLQGQSYWSPSSSFPAINVLAGKVGNAPGILYAGSTIFFPLFNLATTPFTCDAFFTTSPDPGMSGNIGMALQCRATGDSIFNIVWAVPGYMNVSSVDGGLGSAFAINPSQTYHLRIISDPVAPLVSIYLDDVLLIAAPAFYQDPGPNAVFTLVGTNDADVPMTLDSLSITTP